MPSFASYGSATRAFDYQRHPNLGAALSEALRTYRQNPFLVERDRGAVVDALSYAEFAAAAERVGAALAELPPTARVGIAMSNGPRWLLLAYAALRRGLVLVPLDARQDPASLLRLAAHADLALLGCDTGVAARLRPHAPELPVGTRVVVSRPPGEELPPGWATWEGWLAAAGPATPEPLPRERGDVAAVVYSSGTSGEPKGCLLTHGNYLSQAEVLANLYPLAEDDVYLSILPTNHAIDFMCGFLVPLLCGARVVHLRTLRPEAIVDACQAEGVSHMAAVPAVLEAFERSLRTKLSGLPRLAKGGLRAFRRANRWLTRRRPNHAISRQLLRPVHAAFGGRLRLIFAGGAFVPPSTARFLYELGLPVVIGYGLTEAGAVVTVNDLEPFRDDSVGPPVPGTEVEIRDRDELGIGAVWVRGPSVFAGYLGDPARSAEVLVDGWLRTGDLGVVDASGHLKLLGRAKDMIVTPGGKNVYPDEVEGALRLPGAAELAVFAAHSLWRATPGSDEVLLAVVRPGEGQDPQGLRTTLAAANRRLPAYQRLAGAVFTDAPFPRTTSLKLRRAELAERVAGETSRDAVEALNA